MSKVSFFAKSMGIIVFFLAGVLLINALFPRPEPLRILLDTLVRIIFGLVLYLFFMNPEEKFGFSIGVRFKKPTLVLWVGYSVLIMMLLLWKINAITLQTLSPTVRVTEVIHTFDSYLVVVIAAPFFEEILFRGLLQSWAYQTFPGRFWIFSRATLVTTLLFGLSHIPVWLFTGKSVLYLIFTTLGGFLFGLILGLVRDKGGNLYWTILLHSVGNLL